MANQIPDIKQSCLRCGNKELITDTETGEIFCGGCGFVSSEHTESTGPERRSFSGDGINRERTGAGTSLAIHDQDHTFTTKKKTYSNCLEKENFDM